MVCFLWIDFNATVFLLTHFCFYFKQLLSDYQYPVFVVYDLCSIDFDVFEYFGSAISYVKSSFIQFRKVFFTSSEQWCQIKKQTWKNWSKSDVIAFKVLKVKFKRDTLYIFRSIYCVHSKLHSDPKSAREKVSLFRNISGQRATQWPRKWYKKVFRLRDIWRQNCS